MRTRPILLLALVLPCACQATPPRDPAAVVEVAPPGPVAPVEPPPLADEVRVAEVTAGAEFTCARSHDGEVYCWGSNDRGQLGDLGQKMQLRPMQIHLAGAAQIGAGNFHACARHDDGAVSCWGSRVAGQTGDGAQGQVPPTGPVRAAGLSGVKELAVGARTSCAVRADGHVFCWGVMLAPAAGVAARPVEVPDLAGVTKLDMGPDHGCGIWPGNLLKCWAGKTPFRLLGSPGITGRGQPDWVPGLPRVRAVAAGGFRSCAAADDGSLHCWGDRMQDGPTTIGGDLAQRVPGIADVVSVDVEINHVCAIRADRSVWCFGSDNHDGRLGDGTQDASLVPRRVVGIDDAVAIAIGEHHSCALTARGALYCWGGNEEGQLGDGTTRDRLSPVRIRWPRGSGGALSPNDPRSARR